MQNNISVSIPHHGAGADAGGPGTRRSLMLFYNGVILGGVCLDYITDGQDQVSHRLAAAAWLRGNSGHPAALVRPKALRAGAAHDWMGHARRDLRSRLRAVVPDLATLIGGVSIMLVWAGFIEAFFQCTCSAPRTPILPYSVKIAFGLVEIMACSRHFSLARRPQGRKEAAGGPGKMSDRRSQVSLLNIATPEGDDLLPAACRTGRTRALAYFVDFRGLHGDSEGRHDVRWRSSPSPPRTWEGSPASCCSFDLQRLRGDLRNDVERQDHWQTCGGHPRDG